MSRDSTVWLRAGRLRPRPSLRAVTAALLPAAFLTAVLGVTGCGAGNGDRERIDAIVAGIQQELAEHPDVSEAQVAYYDYVTDPKTVKADLTVQPGAEVEPLIDATTRLIWRSDIDPLVSLSVRISHPGDRTPRQTRIWNVVDSEREDYQELEQRHGPRPTSG